MQPFANHLTKIHFRVHLAHTAPMHARSYEPLTVQMLDPVHYQPKTKQRRFHRQEFGLFDSFDRQDLCGCLDQRLCNAMDVRCAPEYLEGENANHGHPVTELGWIARHGTVCVTEPLNYPRCRSPLNLDQKGATYIYQFLHFPWFACGRRCRGARCGTERYLNVRSGANYWGEWG
jgi:hypothetical protein